jgi:type IV secretion system protein VirB6
MGGLCQSDPDMGLVQGLLASVDCNAQAIAQAGYGAIASPASPLAAGLTIVMTLYIAFIGLRLTLGLMPVRVGELSLAALKIGLVLALATHWPTYQKLVSDTLVRGPEQVGVLVLRNLEVSSDGPAADPLAGLQTAYDQIQAGAAFFDQHPPSSAPAASVALSPGAQAPVSGAKANPNTGASDLRLSAMLLLADALAPLMAAKIVLAVLLAVGPIFLAMLFFDATRGLFEGWLRAAFGASLVPLMVILGLVVQLTILQPQLEHLQMLQDQAMADTDAAFAIFLLCLMFTVMTVGLIIAAGVLAFGFRLPSTVRRSWTAAATVGRGQAVPVPVGAARSAPAQAVIAAPVDRALLTARAVAAIDRREAQTRPAPAHGAPASRGYGQAAVANAAAPGSGSPRPAGPRRAASSARRDR